MEGKVRGKQGGGKQGRTSLIKVITSLLGIAIIISWCPCVVRVPSHHGFSKVDEWMSG